MKNLSILIIFTILFSISFAKTVTVINGGAYSRISDSSLDSAGWVKEGESFTVLEETGAWYFVEVVSGSDNVGKQGWIWRELLTESDWAIKGKGANLRSSPITSSDVVCSVKGATIVKLLKKDVKWYKIGEKKYIYYQNVKVAQ